MGDVLRLTESEKEKLIDVLFLPRHKVEWFLVDTVTEILAEHTQAARAEGGIAALEEAADGYEPMLQSVFDGHIVSVPAWLRARAAALRSQGAESAGDGEA